MHFLHKPNQPLKSAVTEAYKQKAWKERMNKKVEVGGK